MYVDLCTSVFRYNAPLKIVILLKNSREIHEKVIKQDVGYSWLGDQYWWNNECFDMLMHDHK